MDQAAKIRWFMDCIQKLPVEIWDIVLTQTYDFNRRKYYLNANQLEFFNTNFEQLRVVLGKLRTSYLFERVLKVIIGYLNRRNIYQCRLICKRWTTAVDGFLEKPPCFEAYDQSNYGIEPSFYLLEEFIVDLGDPSILERFENIVDNVPTNPFIGRYIGVTPEINNLFWENPEVEDIYQNQSLERLCQILQRLGKYVWHLKWSPIKSKTNGITIYASLCRILQYLPNLKTLQVVRWRDKGRTKEPIAHSIQNVDSFIFPKMESLYYVGLGYDVIPLPDEIPNAIISSFGIGLKKLCLNFKMTKFEVFHSGLRNLNELHMHIDSKDLLSNVVSQLTTNAIPVKKFKGSFTSFDVYNLLDILRPLNLEAVSFSYSELTEETINDSAKQYSFDSIKNLEIMDCLALTYQFLKYMPNLEYLSILRKFLARTAFKQLEIPNQIRRCLYRGISPPLDFWRVFPTLKYIIVEYDNQDLKSKYYDYNCMISRYARCPEN